MLGIHPKTCLRYTTETDIGPWNGLGDGNFALVIIWKGIVLLHEARQLYWAIQLASSYMLHHNRWFKHELPLENNWIGLSPIHDP